MTVPENLPDSNQQRQRESNVNLLMLPSVADRQFGSPLEYYLRALLKVKTSQEKKEK